LRPATLLVSAPIGFRPRFTSDLHSITDSRLTSRHVSNVPIATDCTAKNCESFRVVIENRRDHEEVVPAGSNLSSFCLFWRRRLLSRRRCSPRRWKCLQL
jgi:hypothetical protein